MRALLGALALGALLAGCAPEDAQAPADSQAMKEASPAAGAPGDPNKAAAPGPAGQPAAPPLPPGLGGGGAPPPGGGAAPGGK
jgi:nitrous oxide reductase accessory protein NosL